MKFTELHDTIPYAKGGKEKILRFSPYPNITLAMPGRHALDTVPVGGDFVVMVTDPIYPVVDHQFTHTDIFKDVQNRHDKAVELGPSWIVELDSFMKLYRDVVNGSEPWQDLNQTGWFEHCMHPTTFMNAVQCLAVAEHRRYAKYEAKFGGRFLPFRFAAGIAEGLWAAADASNLQRRGRPGVEILERTHGTPILTKELMG